MSEEISFDVLQDAYIELGNPDANFGNAPILLFMSSDPFQRSLLSFTPDFSLDETQVILSIWLNYMYPGNTNNAVHAYATLENFDEQIITAGNYTGDTTEGSAGAIISEGIGWKTIDITGIYRYHKGKSHDFCGMIATMSYDDELLEFSSKEGSHTPYITITYEPPLIPPTFSPLWQKQIGTV